MRFLRAIAWTLVKRLIHTQFPNVQSLSTRELAVWLTQVESERPLVVDARTLEEYEVSHLLGAHLAPCDLQELSHWPRLTTATPIVTYCSVGYRSAELAQHLQAMGYKNVLNLEGSIFEWVNEGHPVYQGEQAVQQVHPFNSCWGLLLHPNFRLSSS